MKRILTLMMLLIAAILTANPLYAQRPRAPAPTHKSLRQTIAAADSLVDSSALKIEFGVDKRALQTGDSLPADARIGYAVSKAFTIEGLVAAQQDSGYIEADVSLGLTAAVLSGSTNYHGEFLFASPIAHYERTHFSKVGVMFGTGMRQVASTSAGMLVRAQVGTIVFAGEKPRAFVTLGVSLLK